MWESVLELAPSSLYWHLKIQILVLRGHKGTFIYISDTPNGEPCVAFDIWWSLSQLSDCYCWSRFRIKLKIIPKKYFLLRECDSFLSPSCMVFWSWKIMNNKILSKILLLWTIFFNQVWNFFDELQWEWVLLFLKDQTIGKCKSYWECLIFLIETRLSITKTCLFQNFYWI